MADTPLHRLAARGQSVWLDFISRELVTTDALQRLIDDRAVTGMTSNPTIFEKAIGQGTDYDAQLRDLVGGGTLDPDELFIALAVQDIRAAADTLRPAYDRTDGGDGFVSLEVAPGLADDTAGTVAMARTLWERVDRPNLMIKVPATPAGIPAIEELIAAGLNINVTLIFALSAYESVAEAYIRGLERRRREGKDLSPRSVASFFVSRVDTEVDRRLEERGGDEATALLGTAAIANAVLAYERFEAIFHGSRFAPLREAGAKPQRPLWASTSAKNPKYRDVVYAEALIGPDTVDTMPPATIDAFADHGEVPDHDTVNADYPGAHRTMERLAAAGIDMDAVTQHLLEAGVASFADSYSSLIGTIAEKADRMSGAYGARQHVDLGTSTQDVLEQARLREEAGDVRRLFARDPDLWKPGDADHAAVIRNRLGWLDVVGIMQERLGDLHQLTASVRDEGVRDAVLLGMGGSSLAPELFRTAFGAAAGSPTLHVLDTTDPAAVQATTAALDLRRSLFIVASKSGGTVETLSHLAHFWEAVTAAGEPAPGRRFIAITDPGTSLAELARDRGFRHVFENPADIGGRYSALSYFGLVPAAIAGIDVATVLERAATMLAHSRPGVPVQLNPALVLGTVMAEMHDAGRDKVTILAPPRLAAFSLWAEQLIAESTGKEGRGLVPIGDEPVGDPAVYGDDRLVVALRLGDDAAFDAQVGALRQAGIPAVVIEMTDLYDLGAEFVRWEVATALAGARLQIDPFDEPNVTESKENTRRLLGRLGADGRLPASEPAPPTPERLRELLAEVRPGDYVALQAYVTPDDADHAALQSLRTAVRDAHRVATTLGFGPRFLHSTGQLHKGGPDTGVFVQITVDDEVDVPIPGQPYTFSVLKHAQADGDLQSLRDHGRRTVRLHAGSASQLTGVLRALTDAVRPAVGAV